MKSRSIAGVAPETVFVATGAAVEEIPVTAAGGDTGFKGTAGVAGTFVTGGFKAATGKDAGVVLVAAGGAVGAVDVGVIDAGIIDARIIDVGWVTGAAATGELSTSATGALGGVTISSNGSAANGSNATDAG